MLEIKHVGLEIALAIGSLILVTGVAATPSRNVILFDLPDADGWQPNSVHNPAHNMVRNLAQFHRYNATHDD